MKNKLLVIQIVTVICVFSACFILYKNFNKINELSETLESRKKTVDKLENLYSEIKDLVNIKQSLILEAKTRDISSVDEIMEFAGIDNYSSVNDTQTEKEGVVLYTKIITIPQLELDKFKKLSDAFIQEWPFIRVLKSSIEVLDDNRAAVKIKVVETQFDN